MPATNVLALDVGERRVGLALAHGDVRVPVPAMTLQRQDADFWPTLMETIENNSIGCIVVGLPRGLDGQETVQTQSTREFAQELSAKVDLPINWQDEAMTSVKAKAELLSRGKPYAKSDIDALAASFILEDFLENERYKK